MGTAQDTLDILSLIHHKAFLLLMLEFLPVQVMVPDSLTIVSSEEIGFAYSYLSIHLFPVIYI